mmetsp:Transcript_28865/g.73654  ORF Transcript_28865/g.73654 Transcript_28865/m.73654 type:complete len:268 (+) Transcript_28865:559-1362(+)
MPSWYSIMACSTAGSCAPMMRTASSPALAALPIATVATGTPLGICTMDSSASRPSRCAPAGLTGTPTTGSGVMAATMPGRCAAPPAPAMMTLMPRLCAVRAYSNMRSGVRCADTTDTSHPMPNSSSTWAAAFMVGRSLSLPMMMPTCTLAPVDPPGEGMAAARALEEDASAADAWGSMRPRRRRASSRVGAQMLMCPTLRPFFMPSLPYQCTLAPATWYARPITSCAILTPCSPSASPSRLSMMDDPTVSEVSPSGQPMTARTWFSN